jgi:hypothetical protein
MRTTALRWSGVAIVLTAALSSACSTNARRVDCEWRLEPINQPAPKSGSWPKKTLSEKGREAR